MDRLEVRMYRVLELNLEDAEKVAAGTVSECTELGQAYVDCKAADGLIGVGTTYAHDQVRTSEQHKIKDDEGSRFAV